MSSVITVRGIDPGDKSWLKREARETGVSMEEFVRRLIREQRERARTAHQAVRCVRAVLRAGARSRPAAARPLWIPAGRVRRRG